LSGEHVKKIEADGFLVCKSSKLRGICPEWYHTTYHTRQYVVKECSRLFRVLSYMPEGMGYQDVVIVERPLDLMVTSTEGLAVDVRAFVESRGAVGGGKGVASSAAAATVRNRSTRFGCGCRPPSESGRGTDAAGTRE
jgi:hypothetical protein